METRWVNGVPIRRLDLYQFKGQELLKNLSKTWTTKSPKSCFLFVFQCGNTEACSTMPLLFQWDNVTEEIVPGYCLHCILFVCFVFLYDVGSVARSWGAFWFLFLHLIHKQTEKNTLFFKNKWNVCGFCTMLLYEKQFYTYSFENEIETFMNALQYMTHNVWVMYCWRISNVFTTVFVGDGILLYVSKWKINLKMDVSAQLLIWI